MLKRIPGTVTKAIHKILIKGLFGWMKRKVLVLLILVVIGCKKDQIVQTSVHSMSVEINGISWSGETSIAPVEKVNFNVRKDKVIDGVIVPWENFSIGYFNKILGKQHIYPYDTNAVFDPVINRTASFTTRQDDGDVLCDYFDVIEADSLDNWVQITREENNFGEVWGVFQVSLYRVNGCAASIYPDTLRLTNGTFHLVLE